MEISAYQSSIEKDILAIASIKVVPSILEVICRTTGMGFAAVARVTEDKWVACSVLDEIDFGLKAGGELKVETTICHEIRLSEQGVVIDHVSDDENYSDHHTPALYGFQSYISIPIIRKDGSFFGTLCAIDPKPAQLNNPQTINLFKLYADLISFHLHALGDLQAAEMNLKEEKELAELREQFIAVLGHDLRNPVGAVSNAADLLKRLSPDENVLRLANIIKDSSFRIKGLIDNIMDFASGRLGGGISLDLNEEEHLEKMLSHVIEELRMVWPDKDIITDLNITKPIHCDSRRIAQLFSNLLGNAISHGGNELPIYVIAHIVNDEFKLSVTNAGKKIPDEVMGKLFMPFSRGEIKPGHQGLGLGLFISSEISKAHKGVIEVESDAERTKFTLKMPVN